MEITISQANLQFEDGTITHIQVSYTGNNEARERINGQINVPFENVPNLDYTALCGEVKKQLIDRLSDEETSE